MTKAEKWIDKGWAKQDCGCHYGIVGDAYNEPADCPHCGGSGIYWLSPAGRIADYPGGPFRGQISKLENAIFRAGRKEAFEEATHRNISAIHLVPRYNSGGMYPVYDYRIEYSD